MTTTLELLDALRAHLVGFEVPDPCSVGLAVYDTEITAQVPGGGLEPPMVTARLLAWADTLTGPAAEVWRTPAGDRVHVSVAGRLPDSGVLVRVFSALPHTPTGLGARLDPDQRAPVPLAALRYLADLAEVGEVRR